MQLINSIPTQLDLLIVRWHEVTSVKPRNILFLGCLLFDNKGNRWSHGYFILLYKRGLKQGMENVCQRCGVKCWLCFHEESCSWGLRPSPRVKTCAWGADHLPSWRPARLQGPLSPVINSQRNQCGDSQISPFILVFKIKLHPFFFFSNKLLKKMKTLEQM